MSQASVAASSSGAVSATNPSSFSISSRRWANSSCARCSARSACAWRICACRASSRNCCSSASASRCSASISASRASAGSISAAERRDLIAQRTVGGFLPFGRCARIALRMAQLSGDALVRCASSCSRAACRASSSRTRALWLRNCPSLTAASARSRARSASRSSIASVASARRSISSLPSALAISAVVAVIAVSNSAVRVAMRSASAATWARRSSCQRRLCCARSAASLSVFCSSPSVCSCAATPSRCARSPVNAVRAVSCCARASATCPCHDLTSASAAAICGSSSRSVRDRANIPLSRRSPSLPPVTLPEGRTISPARVTRVGPPLRPPSKRRAVGKSSTTTMLPSASSTAGWSAAS